jgi:hypothetical protein
MSAAPMHSPRTILSSNFQPDRFRGWPDDVRLSDIEDRFTCTACGKNCADVRLINHFFVAMAAK